MSRLSLNPLSELARLEEDLKALGRIERAIENGLRDTCERLDRIANLLEAGLQNETVTPPVQTSRRARPHA